MKGNDRASNNCSLNVIFEAELETSERTKEGKKKNNFDPS